MSSTFGKGSKVKIELEKRNYKPGRFKYMVDPPVVSAPFTLIVDEDKCMGCGVCIKNCPGSSINMVPKSKYSDVQAPACQFNCPAGTDIRAYIKLLNDGASLAEAWKVLTRNNPFPSVTGRVCPHPCESACNRTYLDGAAVNINCVERTVGDFGLENGLAFEKSSQKKNEKIAIVGSGPAGLSCAYQLALMGYDVTVFEASSKPGGMLRYAIPAYRLPETVVDAEIGRIVNLGVTMKPGTVVGKDISFDELKRQFKAVYVAIGAQGSTAMGVEGEEGNVLSGLAFLKSVKEKNPVKLGRKVVVIGGGNTAIDAARTARRLGSEVTILYRRTAAEMPAHEEEVQAAREEGVKIQFLCAPVKIGGSSNSVTVTCTKMELGTPDSSGRPKPVPIKNSEFDVQCETVISAIGQDLNLAGLESIPKAANWIGADALGQTAENGVFAGGDAVTGPGLVADAIGAGRKAALAIDAFIRGEKFELPVKTEVSYKDIPLMGAPHFRDTEDFKRNDGEKLDVSKRLANPDAEEALPFGQDQAASESRRCLGCGSFKASFAGLPEYFGKICLACHDCETVCPNRAVVMPNFYRIDEGRFATDYDFPLDSRDGMPNPLRLEKPAPFTEIESHITSTEKVIYERRSVRIFKPDPVPRELIERVLEAGRFAPTAGNCIGYKVTVITDKEVLDEWHKSTIFFLSNVSNLTMIKNPLWDIFKRILVLVRPSSFDQRPMAAISGLTRARFGSKHHRHGINEIDCFFDAPCAILLHGHHHHVSHREIGLGIIAQNMVLAAHSLGLGTCYQGLPLNTLKQAPWMKLKKGLHQKLGIEWPYEPTVMFVMGYPAVKIDGAVPREFPQVKWT
ncbi:MAG: NAD(P)-binding protein [Smithella sp.]|jgi:NADPH-dependent glutamate synthase beta subunit-like oxidoreductase/nitroreductase